MPQPSTQDIAAPFDPTGYVSISGADLLTLIQGAIPNVDQGFVLSTDDVAGNPQVPDAVTNPKWQRYVWVRQSASTVSAYAWAVNGVSDPTYLQWVSLTIAGIGVGSIIGSMIADNTITDVKIVSLDYSKLTGAVPTELPPSGAAGGNLGGTYPNPTIASLPNLIVTTASLNTEAVTGLKIASKTIDPSTKLLGNGTPSDQIKVNADGDGFDFFTPLKITNLANPVVGDATKLIRVNGAGTDYEKVSSSLLGAVLQKVTTLDNAYTNITSTIPYDDTIPQIGEGTELGNLATTITPLSATSKLLIEVAISADLSANNCIVALFNNADADAVASTMIGNSGTGLQPLVLTYLLSNTGATTARTYHVRLGGAGAAGNIDVNGSGGVRKLGGSIFASVTITEYI